MAYIAEESLLIIWCVMGIYISSDDHSGFFGRLQAESWTGLLGLESNFILFSMLNIAGAWSMAQIPAFRPRSSQVTASFRESYSGLVGHFRNRRLMALCINRLSAFLHVHRLLHLYSTFYLVTRIQSSTTALGLIFFLFM